MKTPNKVNPSARHKARRFALQALYEWQVTHEIISVIVEQYAEEPLMRKADAEYFQELLVEIPARHVVLDEYFKPVLDRLHKDLNLVEMAILRIATYELAHRLEIPYKVIINEAIELAKEFGAEESHKYINGVLDQVAQQLRKTEMNA